MRITLLLFSICHCSTYLFTQNCAKEICMDAENETVIQWIHDAPFSEDYVSYFLNIFVQQPIKLTVKSLSALSRFAQFVEPGFEYRITLDLASNEVEMLDHNDLEALHSASQWVTCLALRNVSESDLLSLESIDFPNLNSLHVGIRSKVQYNRVCDFLEQFTLERRLLKFSFAVGDPSESYMTISGLETATPSEYLHDELETIVLSILRVNQFEQQRLIMNNRNNFFFESSLSDIRESSHFTLVAEK